MKVILVLILSFSALSQNKVIPNFGEAKSILRNIYGNKNITFYCGCAYQKRSIKSGCSLKSLKKRKRDTRLEWEHIVPASRFGKTFESWSASKSLCPPRKRKNGKMKKISSRKCASKKSKSFRLMSSDLFNLVPVVGTVNAWRSAKKMKVIKDGKIICNDVSHSKGFFSPPKSKKGNIARIYLYMSHVYPDHFKLSQKEIKMFDLWNKTDPVDDNECKIYYHKSKMLLLTYLI